MQGLLAQSQAPQAEPQAVPAPQSGMVDIKQAQAELPAMMDKLKRLVLAGQMVLYSKESSDKFLRFLDRENIPLTVGNITAMVMAALIDKGREQAAPPKLVVPAGAMIAADLLDYACGLYDVEMTDDLARETLAAYAEAMQNGVKAGMEGPQIPGQQQPQQPQAPQQQQQGAMV